MINLTFETLDDMVAFAKRVVVLGDPVQQVIQAAPVHQAPVQQTAPVQTMPVQQAPVQQVPIQQTAPVQTTVQEYVLDDIAKAAMTLMDKGMQRQLQELLAGYGVGSLPELPKEHYGNFATALRGMGAQI